MTPSSNPNLDRDSMIVHRTLDLGAIDAVGFDLDHTLALYDDDAVNALALAEARQFLVAHRGYRPEEVDVVPHPHDTAAARTLAIDLATAHVVKLDSARRVHVSRRGRVWSPVDAIARDYERALPDRADAVHALGSRFDVPTLWLFDAVARARATEDTIRSGAFSPATACRDVRQMLDRAHTHGRLKGLLMRDLPAFVRRIETVTERLLNWQRAGKTLFVVTNSETHYASAVLDLAIGPQWRALFSMVCTSAAKPHFFSADAPSQVIDDHHYPLVEGARAPDVERHLGVAASRIAYVGDNARADVRAARDHGWRTIHIAAEMNDDDATNPWGLPLLAGPDASWFAVEMRRHADVACDRVDRFLAVHPHGVLTPTPQ